MKKEAQIIKDENTISVIYDDRCIKIAHKHNIYLNDIKYDFDFYFNSVEYEDIDGLKTIDFSISKSHKTKGFDDFPVMYASFSEPVGMFNDYLKFAELDENSIVLDLGAYAGLSAILFDKELSKNNKEAKGKVIAVDPDKFNKPCIEENFKQYKNATGRTIEYEFGAIWGCDGELDFSSEANMGASAVAIVGENRDSEINKVPCFCLSTLAEKYNLEKIDFIKCDVEGGEIEVFKDYKFFEKYNPRIIIETHFINGEKGKAMNIASKYLSRYGYTFKAISQNEQLYEPILECYPALNEQEKTARILSSFPTIWQEIDDLKEELSKQKELLFKQNEWLCSFENDINLKKTSFLEKIFSLKNEGKHKVLRVLGVKLKIKRKDK